MALRETITIRPYRAGDETAILHAVNRARGAAGLSERSLATWRWMFADHPLGTRVMLGFDEGGEVLAQCAGLPLRARVDGRAVLFCRMIDGLNVRSERTGHTRRGLFTACSEAFREAFGGEGSGRHVFAFGSHGDPDAGRLPLGMSFLRECFVHVVPVGAARGGDWRAEIREVERFGAEANELHERIATEARADLVRDAAYLNWRHASEPGRPARAALACVGGRPAGLAVWRAGRFEGRAAGLVCEWIVPRDEPAAATALSDWLQESARAAGLECVVLELSPFAREWTEFQDRGYRVVRRPRAWWGASHLHAHHNRFFARHVRFTLSDVGDP